MTGRSQRLLAWRALTRGEGCQYKGPMLNMASEEVVAALSNEGTVWGFMDVTHGLTHYYLCPRACQFRVEPAVCFDLPMGVWCAQAVEISEDMASLVIAAATTQNACSANQGG